MTAAPRKTMSSAEGGHPQYQVPVELGHRPCADGLDGGLGERAIK